MYYPYEDPASRNSHDTVVPLISIGMALFGSFLLFFFIMFFWTLLKEGGLCSPAHPTRSRQNDCRRSRRQPQERRRAMSFCDIVPPYLLPPLPDYAECSQPPPPFMEQSAPLKRISTAPSNLTKPMELASWSPSPPPPTPGQPLDPLTPPRRQKRTGYGSFRSEVLPPPAYSGQVQEETAVQ